MAAAPTINSMGWLRHQKTIIRDGGRFGNRNAKGVGNMASKNATKVTIGGKTYTLSGNESEEYLQEVAAYLNGKIAQLRSDEDYRNVPFDMRNVLLQLNLADDYFKARSEIRQMQKQAEEREQELADLKHELVAVQMKLEAALHKKG